MNIKDFLEFYISDGIIQTISERIKPNIKQTIGIKSLNGSLDAVVAASVYNLNRQNILFILHDKEEAAYFLNDLQNLLPTREIMMFPGSYKKPYDIQEIDNANILFRAEVLNRINHKDLKGEIIVTYPEALAEKVINKRSLLQNTYSVKLGDQLELQQFSARLISYDFEKTDFVYEAGQFSIRGGIIDIFSYANELPYRIELFGNEVDGIRTFNPETQLSDETLKEIHIIPNIQTRLKEEYRDSFLTFLPKNTKIWIKDVELIRDTVQKCYDKSKELFESLMNQSDFSQVVLSPEKLFETSTAFMDAIVEFTLIEFGNRFYLDHDDVFEYDSISQPSFNKNFDLLAENLEEYQEQGYTNIISSESEHQLGRLKTIFEEINPDLEFRSLNLELRNGFIDKNLKITLYTDHQLFERFHRFKTKKKYTKAKSITLRELQTLQPGDYVTHIDYGIGRFVGMDKVIFNKNTVRWCAFSGANKNRMGFISLYILKKEIQ